jgi:oleate hydratase
LKTGNKPGQADLVTFVDSGWLLSVHVPHQPHFYNQADNIIFWGGYGLLCDGIGNYVKKKMSQCSGKELLTEVCMQFGFEKEMPRILENSTCIPSMMPYDTAHFMPRKKSDRPHPVPKGSTNLGFTSQFVEIPNECVFLVETSVRSAMQAVYTLMKLNKKIPPIYRPIHHPKVWISLLKTLYS